MTNYDQELETRPEWWFTNPRKNFDLTAFHEAGHVVLAHQYGFPIKWTAVASNLHECIDLPSNSVGGSCIDYPTNPTDQQKMQIIETLMAGRIAQETYSIKRYGNPRWIGGDAVPDIEHEQIILSELCGDDENRKAAQFNDLYEGTKQHIETDSVWEKIDRIGIILNNKGFLFGSEILKILDLP